MTDLHARLRTLPFFQSLDAVTKDELLKDARHLRLTRGTALTREGERADDVFFLLDGELSVSVKGRLVGLLDAPRTVGLLALLDGQPRSASLEVFRAAEVIRLSGDGFRALLASRLSFSRAVLDAVAKETREAYAQQEKDRAAMDDFFESPSAHLVPGPYVAGPVEMLAFVMRDDARRLAALLPPGCAPLPGLEDTWLLTVDTFEDVHSRAEAGQGRRFSYREVTPFVPCVGPDLVPGLFCPELYPDNYLALVLGRELYGFPKRLGRIERGAGQVTLSAGHRLVLRASWDRARGCRASELGAHLAKTTGRVKLPDLAARAAGRLLEALTTERAQALWPKVPVLVRKQIPEASSVYERRLAIDALVRVPFELEEVGGYAVLERPRVDFFALDFFLGGQPVAGFRQSVRLSFGAGQTLRDYRAEGALAPRRLERVAGFARTVVRRLAG
ncbi:MAG: acetoacetate decarboxylase family protein [Myxococcales bacterium]|nr:acetoacetate decarboxylase family protein [Myxococcales bacterium]